MSKIFEGIFKHLEEEALDEDLRKWFKEKWVRFGPDGKIRGACARGDDSEGKPKCLPQAKAHALGKKGRKYAASKKRREDPNPERRGPAKNVATKKKSNEGVTEGSEQISIQVRKGRSKFATELSVDGKPAGAYQYDADSGRSIAEVYPEYKGKGFGKILVLHAIYTAAKLGMDFVEDESRTAEYDNVLDSLDSNGLAVNDDGYWYVTGEGEHFLKQCLNQGVAEGSLNEIYKMPPTKDSSQGMTTWAYNDALEKKSPILYKDNNVIIFKANEDLLRYIILQDGIPVLYIGLSKFLDGYKSGSVATEIAGRGKGLAQKAYLSASDILGVPIYSDTTQTDASRLGIWDKLIQQYPDRIVGYDQKTNKNLPLSLTDKGPTVNQNQPIYVDRNKKDTHKPIAPNQRYRTRILKLLPKKQGVAEEQLDELKCWPGYTRVKGVPAGAPGSCKKKTNEDLSDTLCWTHLSDTLTIEEKLSIFEEYYTSKTIINESNDAELKDYFSKLTSLSEMPAKNKKYLLTFLGLTNNKVVKLQAPEQVIVLSKEGNVYKIQFTDGKVAEFPEKAISNKLTTISLFFSNNVAYDKLRTILSLKFDFDGLDDFDSYTKKKTNEEHSCPHCGGEMVSEELMNEKKDACYYKVKSRYKVWPSAYASGALVKCRKKGAKNWGTKSESAIMRGIQNEQDLEEISMMTAKDIDTTKFVPGKQISHGLLGDVIVVKREGSSLVVKDKTGKEYRISITSAK